MITSFGGDTLRFPLPPGIPAQLWSAVESAINEAYWKPEAADKLKSVIEGSDPELRSRLLTAVQAKIAFDEIQASRSSRARGTGAAETTVVGRFSRVRTVLTEIPGASPRSGEGPAKR